MQFDNFYPIKPLACGPISQATQLLFICKEKCLQLETLNINKDQNEPAKSVHILLLISDTTVASGEAMVTTKTDTVTFRNQKKSLREPEID